jgi:hypothetical protein
VACADDPAAKEGAYRLVENERVDPEAIAEGGFASSAADAAAHALLAAIEDTTGLSRCGYRFVVCVGWDALWKGWFRPQDRLSGRHPARKI